MTPGGKRSATLGVAGQTDGEALRQGHVLSLVSSEPKRLCSSLDISPDTTTAYLYPRQSSVAPILFPLPSLSCTFLCYVPGEKRKKINT